jgi:hypothetical protein
MGFTHPPRNELRHLGAKVKNKDLVVIHCTKRLKRAVPYMTGIGRAQTSLRDSWALPS